MKSYFLLIVKSFGFVYCLLMLSNCNQVNKPSTSKIPQPNIVYVLTDQWRAQATGYSGDPNVQTPNLDRLAATAVNFETAVSVIPVCTPYRAALMTGRYPLSTGMFMNNLYLPSEELGMAEIFKEAGYETGYIGKWHLDGHGREEFTPKERRQGFDYWKALECTHDYNNSSYYANNDTTKRKWEGYDAFAQTKDAQQYIRSHKNGNKPFLLVMAYGGPHFPHESAPSTFKKLYPVDAIKLRPNVPKERQAQARLEAQGYYAHCSALDSCIGQIMATLEEVGEAENTILVFTADHGEMLGSQGERPKEKQRPWDESIRIPFLLRYPAAYGMNGYKVKTPLNTPDILPTLLTMSGIPIPSSIEGEDLTGLITNDKTDMDRAVLFMCVVPFAGYYDGDSYRGIRTSRYTYVRNAERPWLLYDNLNDPYQMKNLIDADGYSSLQNDLEMTLQSKLKERGDLFLSKEQYLKDWGYEVDDKNVIPWGNYAHETKIQSPVYR